MVTMWPVRSSKCTSRRSTRTTTPITRSQAERYTPSTLSANAGRAASISNTTHAALRARPKGTLCPAFIRGRDEKLARFPSPQRGRGEGVRVFPLPSPCPLPEGEGEYASRDLPDGWVPRLKSDHLALFR